MNESRNALDEYPELILQRENWPWWRQKFNRPPYDAQVRMNNWSDLRRVCEKKGKLHRVRWPTAFGEGIFFDSVRQLECFKSFDHEALVIGGLKRGESERHRPDHGYCDRLVIECPHGPMTRLTEVKPMNLDLTEVQGIAASESQDRYFKDIYAFGEDFTNYKKIEADEDGLAMMLSDTKRKNEDKDGLFSLGIRTWDGRLFLHNGNGSHHFAGAHYIAKKTGAKCPIRAKLAVHQLNVPAIEWLISNFHIFPLLQRDANGVLSFVAHLVDTCNELKVPGRVCDGTSLLLIPNGHAATGLVIEMLGKVGLQPVNNWFAAMIELERSHWRQLSRRFGSRVKLFSEPLEQDEERVITHGQWFNAPELGC